MSIFLEPINPTCEMNTIAIFGFVFDILVFKILIQIIVFVFLQYWSKHPPKIGLKTTNILIISINIDTFIIDSLSMSSFPVWLTVQTVNTHHFNDQLLKDPYNHLIPFYVLVFINFQLFQWFEHFSAIVITYFAYELLHFLPLENWLFNTRCT